MRQAEEWGALIAAAHRAADQPGGGQAPAEIAAPRRYNLIFTIRAACADGWDYAALERASGVCQRYLRAWHEGG